MKKLTCEQVKKNTNDHLERNGLMKFEENAQNFDCIIAGIVDSINENIENEWIDSIVCFKLDGSIHNGKTGKQLVKWKAGARFFCKEDKGQYISIAVNDKLYDVNKDSVYIVEGDIQEGYGTTIYNNKD